MHQRSVIGMEMQPHKEHPASQWTSSLLPEAAEAVKDLPMAAMAEAVAVQVA
jgi:hypothetical protein